MFNLDISVQFGMLNTKDALTSLDVVTQLSPLENYIGILQHCRKERNLAHAKDVHLHICKDGLDHWLHDYLVPLFVDCGDILYAHHMFNQAAHCSEYMWNSIIQGFVEDGRSQQALDLYQRMRSTLAIPSRYTHVALLKACTRLKNKEMGQQLQTDLSIKDLENDPFVGSAVLHMYAKFGMVREARELFDRFRARDTVSWNALLTGYIENGLLHEAVRFLDQMQSESVCPDAVTYICSLKVYSRLGLSRKGKEAHMEVVKSGLERDHFTNNALVDMYSKIGLIEEAWKLVQDLQLQDIMSWTSFITACVDHGCSEQALLYLKQMQLTGFSPDGMVLASGLKACGRIKDIHSGEEIHAEILKKGLDDDSFLGNALADMYIKCKQTAEAEAVFHHLQERDIVSWNTLITGYAEEGIGGKVHKCLEQMQANGICPDDVTYICFLRLSGSMNDVERGKKIHSEIIMKGFEMDEFVRSSLVDMYAKCGMLSEGIEVCKSFAAHDVVSWNSLITEYVERGCMDDALKCLEHIKQGGLNFDVVTFVLSLKISGIEGSIQSSHCMHSEIIKRGLDTDPSIGNTLVDSYAKCGSHAEAQRVFEKLAYRGVTSWNAIIAGYLHSKCEEAFLDCLEQMQCEGLSPDSVTFTLVIKGLSILEAVDKGREVHSLIFKKGFDEDVAINSTLVGMYADYGSLEDILSVFGQIDVRDIVAWTALITGYANLCIWDEVLNCFEKMNSEQVPPDAIAWACFLKACGNMGEIVVGQKIHAEIVRRGLEEELNICSNLMDMYMKCGLVVDASVHVPCPASSEAGLSWIALSAGYTEDVVLHATLLHALRACGTSADLEGGKKIHTQILKRGLDVVYVVENSVVDMYAQCSALEEVEIVFHKSFFRDIISWNVLIKACTENGASEKALEHFEKMQIEGVAPDPNTYLLCSKACQNIGAEIQGRQLHAEIVKKGHERDSVISSNLLGLYAKSGLLLDARKVFDDLVSPDVVSWTALIAGYVNCGLSEEGLRCSEQMLLERVCPNAITCGYLVKIYSILRITDSCLLLHAEIIKRGFDMETFLCNSIVDMYVKCGLLTEIQDFVHWLPVKDVVLFTTLIIGYYEHGEYEEALNAFKKMQCDNVSPNHVTYSYSLNACSKAIDLFLGQAIHLEIMKRGYEGDLVVGDSLIYMYASCGLFAEALCVLHGLPARDEVSWSILIGGYADHGFTKEAVDCFHLMLHEGIPADEALWNTIILAYVEEGESENAFVSFFQMLQQGTLPDDLLFISLSKACGTVASVELGRRLHAQFWVASESQALQGSFASALIDMYAKCGCMSDAQQIFDATPFKDTTAWNVLLASYSRQGDCVPVFCLFDRMQQKDIQLYEGTLLCVLTACSHGGLVCRGQLLFKTMSTNMSIMPAIEYYTCIIDLLARAGQVEEAFAMIDGLPFPPDLVAYKSLLGACQRWDDIELGKQAFDFVISLAYIDLSS